ncbi:hypothetical protein Glove_193g60 [Diversispora epigaea]|uniref:Uncharacterized protein n=1 Tax=Diversispora epigaea TaxID=1348612 RepID=A0A397ILG3_9GLOM|nr:hypothetical protein Glove_193g60 [Diversispora epigaea]
MPPKSRNVQLAAARKKKQLKKLQITEILSDSSDFNDNDELSDNFKEDATWNDEDLEKTIDKITQSAFDIMLKNVKNNPVVFNNARPLTYHGNSPRTKRRKKTIAKVAIKGSTEITTYFTTPVSLLNNKDNEIFNNLNDLDEVIKREGFNLALEELNLLIKDISLVPQVKNRLQLIIQYINLRLNGYKCMEASKIIAIGIGKGEYQARLIRTWT